LNEKISPLIFAIRLKKKSVVLRKKQPEVNDFFAGLKASKKEFRRIKK
jgi:hypothetical protein